VAAERARDAEPELLRAQIRAVLRAALGIVPERVWILEPRSLPKTTSGKLRRGHARVALQGGRLPEVDERAGSGGQAPPPPVPRLGGVP